MLFFRPFSLFFSEVIEILAFFVLLPVFQIVRFLPFGLAFCFFPGFCLPLNGGDMRFGTRSGIHSPWLALVKVSQGR